MSTTIYHRNLSLEETQAIKNFHLAGAFKTGKEKIYRAEVICRNCKEKKDEFILMVEYSDGSWLKEKNFYQEDFSLCGIETIVINRGFCSGCINKEDKTVVIEYYRTYIKYEYQSIINCGLAKKKPPQEAFETIISAACRAALFEGNYENWRNFLPKRVVEELGGIK